jgi:hypothetical protein
LEIASISSPAKLEMLKTVMPPFWLCKSGAALAKESKPFRGLKVDVSQL